MPRYASIVDKKPDVVQPTKKKFKKKAAVITSFALNAVKEDLSPFHTADRGSGVGGTPPVKTAVCHVSPASEELKSSHKKKK